MGTGNAASQPTFAMKILASPAPADLSTSSAAVISGLNQLLASSYALMANTQFAQWNTEGPNCFALHEAYKQHAENLFSAIDEMAERVRVLDADVVGGISTLSSMAGFEEFTLPLAESELVAGLIHAHRKVTADAITLCDASGVAHDQETQAIAINRIQWHEKTVWMLRNYLK
jgi:starvation-inducible DNA-binding protein